MMKIENVAILAVGIVIILLLVLIVFLLLLKFGGEIFSEVYSDLKQRSKRRGSMRKSWNETAVSTLTSGDLPFSGQGNNLFSSKILITEDNIGHYTNRYDIVLLKSDSHDKAMSMVDLSTSVFNIRKNPTGFNKDRRSMPSALPRFINV